MERTTSTWGVYILALSFSLAFTACGPVNRFTRVKRIPREYAMNYCGTDIKASRSIWSGKAPWVVFSDQLDNFSYRKPTGKNVYKELKFMEPYLVIKEKGDWLKVVKYCPDIIKDGKLVNRKQAQYYGWINKSDLLLTQSSITDLATGLKNKMVTVLADSTVIAVPDKYFKNDSIRVFQDTDFMQDYKKVAMHTIVYPLKESDNGDKTLIAIKSYISPDSVATETLGWIDNALIRNIGQQLHVDINTLPSDRILFKDRYEMDTVTYGKESLQESEVLEHNEKALLYSPIVSFKHSNSFSSFRTGAFFPLTDYRNSYILNVDGNPITYKQFKGIEKQLKQINILFVMEDDNEVARQYPGIINVIQGLQSRFSHPQSEFTYKFGAVLPTKGHVGNHVETIALTSDYMELLNALSDRVDTANKLSRNSTNHNWKSLRKAINMLENHKKETNVIILIGETGSGSEWAETALVNKLADYNCRLLGFQLHSGRPDKYTNFVLQVENMIDSYAKQIAVSKREKIVYADQLRTMNEYNEVKRNIYCLDFPNRSMTQGWVVFPSKDESMPFEGLTSSVDSLIKQVENDNRLVASSLRKAFTETGNFRNRIDSTFIQFHRMNKPSTELITHSLKSVSPLYFIPAQTVQIPDSLSSSVDYKLLLSDAEFKKLKNFISQLAGFYVDYKYDKNQQKGHKNQICGCPDDVWLLKNVTTTERMDSIFNNEYASTRSVRRKLRKLYYKNINTGKVHRLKRREMKQLSLADAHHLIITCPTDNQFLKSYKIAELKRRKELSDETLDMLIDYFKEKKKKLEQAAGNTFKSNGQTYYWISRDMLP